MVVTLALYTVSLVIRSGNPADRLAPVVIALVAYLLLALAAAIGGDLVYLAGTHVNRNAWRGAGMKWVSVDIGSLPDIPQGGPTKLKAGINELAVIREGDRILAVHAVCAHAGGPLAEGTIVGGDRIECPWHGSRYLLANGHVVRGPSMYDQPAYEVRRTESAGGSEARP
jgi:nitrite reductase/ring-hydroxylating ferredoxin subunit